MITTSNLCDLLRQHFGNCTDYKLAQHLKISRTTVGHWVKNRSVMDEENGLKAAKILDIQPEYILLSLQAERARRDQHDEIFSIYNSLADSLADQISINNRNTQAQLGI